MLTSVESATSWRRFDAVEHRQYGREAARCKPVRRRVAACCHMSLARLETPAKDVGTCSAPKPVHATRCDAVYCADVDSMRTNVSFVRPAPSSHLDVALQDGASSSRCERL